MKTIAFNIRGNPYNNFEGLICPALWLHLYEMMPQ